MSPTCTELGCGLSALVESAAALLPAVALAFARLIPIVWLAPTFGGRLLPMPARLCVALGLALVLAPPGEAGEPAFGLALLGGLVVEMLIGLTLGLLASLPFELARASGHLVDVGRGAAMAQVIAPGLDDRASPTGDVLYLALLVALTASGGDRLIVLALAESFTVLPPGTPLLVDAGALMAGTVLEATACLIATALVLAAPPLVAALLADTILGVVGRIVPQLPLFFLGMPIKTVLGLLLVAFALGPALSALFDAGAAMPAALAALSEWLGE